MILHLALLLLLGIIPNAVTCNPTTQDITIEPYNAERDRTAIAKIIDGNPEWLQYEYMGKPAGTTMKYLETNKYITDVARIGDQTVGFINYVDYNITFLTFYFKRIGLIHLMGVDKDYQRQGIGRCLLAHAETELEKRNVPFINLWVKKDNIKARVLYEKEGYTCMIPEAALPYLPQLLYEKQVDIPADKLPQGNIIQRHPFATAGGLLAILGLGIFKIKK